MEYVTIIVISLITLFVIKIGLNIRIKDVKKIKEIGYDKELNKIADKFPNNKEICEEILKKLNNNHVKIEESDETKTSLYIVASNKIVIANIKDTFTRIQTIAHECLHSIQNKKILMFNFICSSIFLLYFITAIFLILFNIGNSLIYILVFIFSFFIIYIVRSYLETEAMSKAPFVAKEYMNEYKTKNKEISDEDIDILVENFERLNKIGIPITNFYIILTNIVKVILLCILAII